METLRHTCSMPLCVIVFSPNADLQDHRSGNHHCTNNRPEDTGRGHNQDEQARATRHDNDSYARFQERRTVRDVAGPQLKPLRVTSEQQDDRKIAAAADAFVPEQNNDENVDPDSWENYKQKLLAQVITCSLCFCTSQLSQSHFVVCYSRFHLKVKTDGSSKGTWNLKSFVMDGLKEGKS